MMHTLYQIKLTDISSNNSRKHIFSSAHRTFSRTDYVIRHTRLSQFKKTEIIPSIFPVYNVIKLRNQQHEESWKIYICVEAIFTTHTFCSLFNNLTSLSQFLKTLFIYFQRGKGREKERERNIRVWLPLMGPLLGTWPTTQACALTRNGMVTLGFAGHHSIH